MNSIYNDIAQRTGGNIYIGVVGPVRSGKSTFVSQFVKSMILPNIDDKNDKKRAIDELPQSADGKIIMTTQPKFVPDKAITLKLEGKATANVRLVDCVGYLVEGVEGHLHEDKPRLINTPWSSEPMPFQTAAELGTHKVATEHSTIAVVVTADGSFGDIPRANFVSAEEKAISTLKTSGKPFVVLLNSANPHAETTLGLAKTLWEKYGVKVLPLNLSVAGAEDFQMVLKYILGEFSVRRITIDLPSWMRALPRDNKVIVSIMETLKDLSCKVDKICDAEKLCQFDCEYISTAEISRIDCGTGTVCCKFCPNDDLFFKILSETAKVDISDEFSLMSYVAENAYAKQRFECMRDALDEADANGYGVVYPLMDKMSLDEPQMIKQGSIYGVRLTAKAPSYHIIKVDVSTDVSPMVGSEQQSQYLLEEYRRDPATILNANMFGKTMSGIARDGLMGKCLSMPIEVKQKLTKTVGRVVNENKGGLICILL